MLPFFFTLISLVGYLHKINPTEELIEMEIPYILADKSKSAVERNGAYLLVDNKRFSGYLVEYFENGRLRQKTRYMNGLREGVSIQYYASGQLKEKRNYHYNNKHSYHQGWWENGTPKFEYHFDNGKHEGPAIEWYASGQLFKAFNYEKGKENGSQKMWEADGKIRANYVVRNGHRYGLIGLKNCKSVNDKSGSYAALAY